MAWVYLAAAAVFEIIFAMSMKASDGFTRPLPTLVTAVAVVAGLGLLTLAMRELPVSIAYPVWTAAGTLGTVILGYVMFQEPLTATKLASALAIVAGVAGLKAAGA
jgi:quaternary ammonium compound-resistance protein SugE